MTTNRLKDHDDAHAYMTHCTTTQLQNIITDETRRSELGGEIGTIAAIMKYEAKRELERRTTCHHT